MSVTSVPAMKISDNATNIGMQSDAVVQEEAIEPQPATHYFSDTVVQEAIEPQPSTYYVNGTMVQEKAIVPQPAIHNLNVSLG